MNNDLISRSHLLEILRACKEVIIENNTTDLFRWVVALIEVSSSVDTEPVVHCRDCIYFKWGDYCTQDKMEHSECREDDFCSYGAKMDGGAGHAVD